MRRKAKFSICLVFVLIAVFGLGNSIAQYSTETIDLQQDSDGRWYKSGETETQKSNELSAQTAGGSDAFGYVWNSNAPLNWIDATSGTDTGMSGFSGFESVGPIQLPFDFNYYENSYPQLWINAGGYLAFSGYDARGRPPSGDSFPNPDWPNGIIAPLWSEYTLAEQGPRNRVYYQSGGVAPNRYFVVQWHQVEFRYPPRDGDTIFEYQVVLHENGNITFQYLDLITNGGYWCDRVATGMEDSRGVIGITAAEWCDIPKERSAIKITRPPDKARVQLLQPYQGEFSGSNAQVIREIALVNNGTLGPDSYNLSSNSGWPVKYYNLDGSELVDTNGDSIVDTGAVNQGAKKTVIAKVQSPTIVNPNDKNHFIFTVTSIKDSSVQAEAHAQIAVPAPFAQAYFETDKGIYLAKPNEQNAVAVSDELGWGSDMSVAENPTGGFIYVGESFRWLDDDYNIAVTEILYTGLDNIGNKRYPLRKLTDHSSAAIDTYDSDAVVAVAPNGISGIIWYRWHIDNNSRRSHNIYFATVNQAGNVAYGPVQLTNNGFGAWNELNVPGSFSPSIVATPDNRFVLAWTTDYDAAQDDTVSNIDYMVKGSGGSTVKPVSRLTTDVPGQENSYGYAGFGNLANGKVGLAYIGGVYWDRVMFTVLESNGQVFKNPFVVSAGGMNAGRTDIAKFSNDNTMIAWGNRDPNGIVSQFAVLDTGLSIIAGPTTLTHPALNAYGPGTTKISLAETSTGQVVATWMDPDWNTAKNLYYAAIDSDGSVLTSPMIFLSSHDEIMTGIQGYGNTTLTITPSVAGVDAYVEAKENNVASADGSAAIPVDFGNIGSTEATSVEVSVTLGDNMHYIGDNSGIIPSEGSIVVDSVSASKYTWSFPKSMDYLGNGRFAIYVSLEGDAVEEINPLKLEVGTAESDGNPDNNEAVVNVLVRELVLMPLIVH